jgi:hypothetical protein
MSTRQLHSWTHSGPQLSSYTPYGNFTVAPGKSSLPETTDSLRDESPEAQPRSPSSSLTSWAHATLPWVMQGCISEGQGAKVKVTQRPQCLPKPPEQEVRLPMIPDPCPQPAKCSSFCSLPAPV